MDKSIQALKTELEDLTKKLIALAKEGEETKKSADGDAAARANGVESAVGAKRGDHVCLFFDLPSFLL